jgi:hypothetical protein
VGKPANTKSAVKNSSENFEFCLRLTRAYATLTRRLDNALSNLHGLSFSDFMILYYLGRAPESRLRRVDLAERLGVTASGVTRSLLPLEKLGLVLRQPDPRDARVGYGCSTQIPGVQPRLGLEAPRPRSDIDDRNCASWLCPLCGRTKSRNQGNGFSGPATGNQTLMQVPRPGWLLTSM